MRRILVAAALLVACKNQQPAPEHESEPASAAKVAPKASASAAKPTVKGKPVVAKNVTVVPCNLPIDAAEGENNVAATRNLHLGPDKALYFFPDFKPPVRLEPTSDGCGYAYRAKTEPQKDHAFGLEPDGSFKEYPGSDNSALTKCKARAFSDVRYGMGRLVGSTYYYKDSDVLTKMNLADDKCEPVKAEFKDVPEKLGTRPSIGSAGDHLLLGYARDDWKYNREIFRFDAGGTLVRKYGAAEGDGQIGGEYAGCGDGLCAVKWQSDLVFYNREGMKVASKSLSDAVKLPRMLIQGIVDVPEKGVYVLIGYIPQKGGKGRAELVRVDGVY